MKGQLSDELGAPIDGAGVTNGPSRKCLLNLILFQCVTVLSRTYTPLNDYGKSRHTLKIIYMAYY